MRALAKLCSEMRKSKKCQAIKMQLLPKNLPLSRKRKKPKRKRSNCLQIIKLNARKQKL